MNKVFLIGRLTKEPEIRATSTGKKVASFTLAVDNGKNANGDKQALFFNCSAWEKLAEIIEQYVSKGGLISIVGKLENKSWEKTDGTKGYSTDILVKELEMLSSKKENKLPEVDLDNINSFEEL